MDLVLVHLNRLINTFRTSLVHVSRKIKLLRPDRFEKIALNNYDLNDRVDLEERQRKQIANVEPEH